MSEPEPRRIRAVPGGGDEDREERLPTSYSPSEIITVAGDRVRGSVSQSAIEKNECRPTLGSLVEAKPTEANQQQKAAGEKPAASRKQEESK